MNRGLPDITESSTELKDRLRGESVKGSLRSTYCKAGMQRIESKSLKLVSIDRPLVIG